MIFARVWAAAALVYALTLLAQRRWPARDVPPVDRTRLGDLAWWLFSPLVTGAFTRVLTLGLVGSLALALGYGLDQGAMLSALRAALPWGPWRLPVALQWPCALVVCDLAGYASHRLRHTKWLWPFHAVHHSPAHLDGLSGARMHPVDDAIDNVLVGAVALVGFDRAVFEGLGAVLLVHTVFTHAALRWHLGPLAGVLTSPCAHRWHHAAQGPSEGCNYAGMFVLWDRLFGTWRDPRGDEPERFGVAGETPPDGLGALLAWPFRRIVN